MQATAVVYSSFNYYIRFGIRMSRLNVGGQIAFGGEAFPANFTGKR
jgi:hypothetical protein